MTSISGHSSVVKADIRHFQLVSRGQVVSTVQPTLTSRSSSGDAYSAEFTVTLTWDMTPVTEVIAYHIVESGHLIQEVVTDSMALNVHGLLENTVSDSLVQCPTSTPPLSLSVCVYARAWVCVCVCVCVCAHCYYVCCFCI